uniref:C-type lectin domain-containing protein n=2 Tax=Caenorhabditis japonica TaxID=281687 RepID=A0A8R1IL85_CAEJA
MLKLFIYILTLVVAVNCACFDNGDIEIGGSCYKLVNQKLSFSDARNWCHYQNPVTASFLTYVPDSKTASFLATYARSAFGSNDGAFWIGLSRNSSSSPWEWDNGAVLGWNNFGSNIGQNYIAENIVNTKWNAYGNDAKLPFVCSYNPTAPPTFGPPVTVTSSTPSTTTTDSRKNKDIWPDSIVQRCTLLRLETRNDASKTRKL